MCQIDFNQWFDKHNITEAELRQILIDIFPPARDRAYEYRLVPISSGAAPQVSWDNEILGKSLRIESLYAITDNENPRFRLAIYNSSDMAGASIYQTYSTEPTFITTETLDRVQTIISLKDEKPIIPFSGSINIYDTGPGAGPFVALLTYTEVDL